MGVHIGAWDCQRQDWIDAYYPPDLPEDWRVAYYANEFSCVGVPASTWQPGQLGLWCDETHGELLFWVGCGAAQWMAPGLADELMGLGASLGGICFEDPLSQNTRAVIAKLEHGGQSISCFAEQASPGFYTVWGRSSTEGPAILGIYRPRPEDDVRSRRHLLESFAGAPGAEERYLLIAGPPDIALEFRQLCDLLGV